MKNHDFQRFGRNLRKCCLENSDIIGDFVSLEHSLSDVYPNRRFFSYRWLLIKLLSKYNLQVYIKFVKPVVTNKTCLKYEVLYKSLTSCSTALAVPESFPNFLKPCLLFEDGDFESQALESLLECGLKHRPPIGESVLMCH